MFYTVTDVTNITFLLNIISSMYGYSIEFPLPDPPQQSLDLTVDVSPQKYSCCVSEQLGCFQHTDKTKGASLAPGKEPLLRN